MPTSHDLLPREPGPEAEVAYIEFLKARESGAAVEFEELCRSRPELASELKLLHGTFEWMEAARGSGAAEPEATDAQERYSVRREIGSGGMGIVFEVWDSELRRKLAMKVSRTAAPAGDALTPLRRSHLRFLEEAQITAQLDHPGVVPIHELGVDREGHVYFTMRQVEGRTLREVFELVERGAGDWSRTRALGVLVQVCETLAFAHSRGVVHRDLKPANVMVGRFGEVYVMDWGLAKLVAADPGVARPRRADGAWLAGITSSRSEAAGETPRSPLATLDGAVLGTPGYMPPEQAHGRVEDAGAAGDVYAVGAMLYHLLTGAKPYAVEAQGDEELLELVRRTPPRPIERLRPETPPELVAVCEKAMARAPEERYADMEALAADLRAFLENRVVSAHRTGPLVEARKWIGRNRALALVMAGALVLLVAALALQVGSNRELRRANRETAFENYVAGIALAERDLGLGDVDAALASLEACPPALRGWEWIYQWQRTDGSLRTLIEDQPESFYEVAFHPFEPWVAAVDWGGTVRVLDTADGALVTKLAAGCRVIRGVAFSPDGRWLAAGCEVLRLWSVRGWELERELEPRAPVMDLAFEPGGTRLAAACQDGAVRVWDAARSGPPLERRYHPQACSVAWSPDGARLASNSATGAIVVVDADTLEPRLAFEGRLTGHDYTQPWELNYSPDGALLAFGQPDGAVSVWDAETGVLRGVLRGHAALTVQVEFVDGNTLVTGSHDDTLAVWDWRERRLIQRLHGHEYVVNGIALDHRRELAASASSDGSVRLWDLGSGHRPELVLRSSQALAGARVSGAQFSPDGSRVAACRRSLEVWDAASGELLRTLPGAFHNLAFAPDGGLLYATGSGPEVAVLDLEAGLPREPLRGAGGRFPAVSPDGRWLAVGGERMTLFDLAAGSVAASCPGGGWPGFDPSSQRVAFRLEGGDVQVARCPTLAQERVLQGNGSLVTCVAFSPDGALVAGARFDGTLPVWDAQSGALLRVLPGHPEIAYALDFSPDGTRLASCSNDSTIKLWDVASGREVLSLLGHHAMVDRVDFSPDGRALVSSANDGTVRVWKARFTPGELALAENQVSPSLAGRGPRADALRALARAPHPDPTVTAAEAMLLRQGLPSYREINDACWELVRLPGRARAAYAEAAERQRAVCAAQPDSATYANTLGLALWRLGSHREAAEVLERADALNQAAYTRYPRANDQLPLAMCLRHLGQEQRARGLYEQHRGQGGEAFLEGEAARLFR